MNELDEMEFQNFILNLFSKPIQPIKSINLQFINPNKNLNNKDLVEILMLILAEGLKYFYGNNGKVDLALITEDNFKMINQYFNSFGFTIYYNISFDNPMKIFPEDTFEDILTLRTMKDNRIIFFSIGFSLYK